MRRLFPLCIVYLLIVTTYMIIARDSLQKSVKQKYIASYVDELGEAVDYKSNDGKCTVATHEFNDNKSNDNKSNDNKSNDNKSNDNKSREEQCLSTKKVMEIKTSLLDAQPVYSLNPEILNTTLSICNPRRASCF